MSNYSIIDETVANPLVTVAMLAYNHEKFIEEAIDSVLAQKVDFSIQIVIAEDCSTDNTRNILLEYQKKHPKTIKLILQHKNVGSKQNNLDLLYSLTGTYIAALECDDYWTDPLKLQKQVDFLELNKDISFCCHRYRIFKQNEDRFFDEIHPLKFEIKDQNNYVTINKSEYHSNWITQPLTAVFRRDALMRNDLTQFKYFRDVHLFYLLLNEGDGVCFEWVGGVYRHHDGGEHIGSNWEQRAYIAFKIYEELYLFSKDPGFFKIYLANCLVLLKRRSSKTKEVVKSLLFKLSFMDKIKLFKFIVSYKSTKKA